MNTCPRNSQCVTHVVIVIALLVNESMVSACWYLMLSHPADAPVLSHAGGRQEDDDDVGGGASEDRERLASCHNKSQWSRRAHRGHCLGCWRTS